MAMQSEKYNLKKVILDAIHERSLGIIAEEAAIAADKVDKRIRGIAGQIAMEAANYYSIEERSDNLVITIRKN